MESVEALLQEAAFVDGHNVDVQTDDDGDDVNAVVADDVFDVGDFDANELLTSPDFLDASKEDFSFNASGSEGDFGVFECEPKSNHASSGHLSHLSDNSFSNSDSFAICSPQQRVMVSMSSSPRRQIFQNSASSMPPLQPWASPSKNSFKDSGTSLGDDDDDDEETYESSPLPYSHDDRHAQHQLHGNVTAAAAHVTPFLMEEPLRPPSRLVAHESSTDAGLPHRRSSGLDEETPELVHIHATSNNSSSSSSNSSGGGDINGNNSNEHDEQPLTAVFEDALLGQPSRGDVYSDEHGRSGSSTGFNDHALQMRMSSVAISNNGRNSETPNTMGDVISSSQHRSSPQRSFSTNSYFRPGMGPQQQQMLNNGMPMMPVDGVVGMDQQQQQMHGAMPQQLPLHQQQGMAQSQQGMMPQQQQQQCMPHHNNMHQQHMNGGNMPNQQQQHPMHSNGTSSPQHMMQQQHQHNMPNMHNQMQQQQQHQQQMHQQQRFLQMQQQQQQQQMQQQQQQMQQQQQHMPHNNMPGGPMQQGHQGHNGHGMPAQMNNMQQANFQNNMQSFHNNAMMNHSSHNEHLNNSHHHPQQQQMQQHQGQGHHHHMNNGNANGMQQGGNGNGFQPGLSSSSSHGPSAFAGMHNNISIATQDAQSPAKSHLNGNGGFDPQVASSPASVGKNQVGNGNGNGGPHMNNVMEKLSETMRRSAMSRSMVKQFSSHNLVRHNSMRGLMVKQGSARNMINQGAMMGRHASNRNLMSQGGSSNRNLMSQGSSNRNLMSQGSSNRNLMSQGSSDRNLSGDGMVPRTPPARRMSNSSHQTAKHHLQHVGRGLMRHDSQQSLNGQRSNHGISVQIDGRNVGMI